MAKLTFVDQFDTQSGSVNPIKDEPNSRELHYSDGKTVKLERRDPYGFIFVVWPRGFTPEALAGVYTSFDQAKLAVENYFEQNTFAKKVDEPSTIPEIQYKRVKKEEAMASA